MAWWLFVGVMKDKNLVNLKGMVHHGVTGGVMEFKKNPQKGA